MFVENYSVYYIPDVGGGGGDRRRIYPISDSSVVEKEVVMHGIPDWIYEGGRYEMLLNQIC